jgi:hypothetical protein
MMEGVNLIKVHLSTYVNVTMKPPCTIIYANKQKNFFKKYIPNTHWSINVHLTSSKDIQECS